MNSMTGFGRGSLTDKLGMFTVEISSVNNRFLEMSVRLPRQFSTLEPRVRELLSSKLVRGKVFLYVGFDVPDDAPGKYTINMTAAKAYYRHLTALKDELGLSGVVEVRDLLNLPDIGTPSHDVFDEDLTWASLQRPIAKALNELVKMRRREGAAMAKEMGLRLTDLKGHTRQVSVYAADALDARRQKLAERVEELLGRPLADNTRLEEEIALLADKSDISEECTRLLSHIDQCRSNLKNREPVGKKLNFILQEMNREANTIASKCWDIQVTRSAIMIKEEVEKLRELVQNVE